MTKNGKELLVDIGAGIGLGYSMTLLGCIHLHREMSHGAVRLHPVVRESARLLTWLGFGSDSRKFAANHMIHHTYAGTNKDPHPTELLGPVKVFFGTTLMNALASRNIPESLQDDTVFHYRGREDDPAFQREEDGSLQLRKHPLEKLISKSWLGVGLGTLALSSKLGAKRAMRIMATNLAYDAMVVGIDNAFAHTVGDRPEPNPGTNMGALASIITGGEAGGHNFHHAHPEVARNAVEGVPDPAFSVIKALERFGLATVQN